MIKAGWNSMKRIDYSTPLTAGSSLARSATLAARGLRVSLIRLPNAALTLPKFGGPGFWFGKPESDYGHLIVLQIKQTG